MLGTLLTLSDFLSLTKNQTSLSAVMIIVEVRSSMPIIPVENSFYQLLFEHIILLKMSANLCENGLELAIQLTDVCVCVCVCVYIYIFFGKFFLH